MSLRAKIEAVVYAAEEPVTLAQLAAVFAPEVREIWLAEKNAAQDAEAGAAEGVETPSSQDEAPTEEMGVGTALPEAGEAAVENAAPPVSDADTKADGE